MLVAIILLAALIGWMLVFLLLSLVLVALGLDDNFAWLLGFLISSAGLAAIFIKSSADSPAVNDTQSHYVALNAQLVDRTAYEKRKAEEQIQRSSGYNRMEHTVWENHLEMKKGNTLNWLPAGSPISSKSAVIPKPPRASKPQTLHDLSWEKFEDYCKDWAKYLGYQDAERTRSVKDGGVDIGGSKLVAQVKFQETPVGVKPVREIMGVNVRLKKDILFFSLNGFSKEAVTEADQSGVALFTVKPFTATILAESVAAKALLKQPSSERKDANEMNQGDYHSGPEGYSANTAYTETQYGSGFDDEADWNEEVR